VVRRERGKIAAEKMIQRVLLNRGDSLQDIGRQSGMFSKLSMAVRGAGAKKQMLAAQLAAKKAAEDAEKDDNPLNKAVRGMLTADPAEKIAPIKFSLKPAPPRTGSAMDIFSIGSSKRHSKKLGRPSRGAKRGAQKHFAGAGKRSMVMVRYVTLCCGVSAL
jgi:hypothetical protein